MRTLILCVLLSGSVGCTHTPPTVTTQQGKIAYTADQIVQRVNELQSAAIAAEANGALQTITARQIVIFAVDANKTLAASPQGWQKTVQTAWLQLKANVGVISNQVVAAAMNAVDAALASLGA